MAVATFMLSRRRSKSSMFDQGTLLRFDELILAGDDAEAVDDVDVGAEVGDALSRRKS